MAQQSYFWEGDLVTGFDYVDLWAHEEWGNNDALGEAVPGYIIVTLDLADRTLLFDGSLASRLLYLDLLDQTTTDTIPDIFFWEGDLAAGFDYVDLWTQEEWGNNDALFSQDASVSLGLSDELGVVRLLSLDLVDQILLADPDTQLLLSKEVFDSLLLSDRLDAVLMRILDFTDRVEFSSDTSVISLLRQQGLVDGVLILDALSSSGGVVVLENAVALRYRPRLLVTLTIGAQTKRYSSEDLEA